MIDEIARAGFKVMIFSGGEPLMRPDIYELVAHAAGNGLRPVFGSNGTLITPEVARRLKEAGACAMGISVDSLDAAKHDKFRGLEHAYDLTMAGIEACKQAGLPFQLHTTVVDWNRDEVCAITDFAVEIGKEEFRTKTTAAATGTAFALAIFFDENAHGKTHQRTDIRR